MEHRRWTARVLRQEFPLLVLEGEFDQDVEHELLGLIASGTLSTEFYWFDRWYNVFRFSDASRNLKSFYCNVNSPPSFDGEVLSYVDLDIDVLVQPDFSYQVLDLEDFENHARLYSYPTEVREHVELALNELIRMVETRSFPFSLH